MSFDLTDWKKGDALAASHLQEPVTALRRMLSTPDAQMPPVKSSADSLGFHFIITLGQIVNHGPNGEVDLTDERYWVRPQYIQGATQRDDPITLADVAPPDEYTGETVFPDQNILAVTNLAELYHGTHDLEVGAYVWFFKISDGADDPVEHAVMSEGSSGGATTDYLQNTADVGVFDTTNIHSTLSDVFKYEAVAASGTNHARADLKLIPSTAYYVVQMDSTATKLVLLPARGIP